MEKSGGVLIFLPVTVPVTVCDYVAISHSDSLSLSLSLSFSLTVVSTARHPLPISHFLFLTSYPHALFTHSIFPYSSTPLQRSCTTRFGIDRLCRFAGYNELISCSERASSLSCHQFHLTSISHSFVLGPRNGRQRTRLITLRTTHPCDSSAFQQAERSNFTIFDINRLECLRNTQSDTFMAYATTAKQKSLTTEDLAFVGKRQCCRTRQDCTQTIERSAV